MNKERRERLVNKAFQYSALEPIYKVTRGLTNPIKWCIRTIMTFLIALVFFPGYIFRMRKLQSNKQILSLSSKAGETLNIYLPNISITQFDITGDYIQMMIFTRRKLYEINVLDYIRDKYIHIGMVFVDVGANIGNHSIYFSKICKAKQVLCFEPIESTYSILKKNIELNNCQNVLTYNIALGQQDSKCLVESMDPHNMGGTRLKIDNNRGSIITRALDSFCLCAIDLIKIDVEGMEYDVLKGAEKSIKQHKPLIMIEIWPENCKAISELLSEYGYCLEYSFGDDNYLYKCIC